MRTLVASLRLSARRSIARAFHCVSPLVFLVATIFVALPGNVAVALAVSLSTGNLLFSDGQGHTMPYRLYVPVGYDAPAQAIR